MKTIDDSAIMEVRFATYVVPENPFHPDPGCFYILKVNPRNTGLNFLPVLHSSRMI